MAHRQSQTMIQIQTDLVTSKGDYSLNQTQKYF